MNQMSVPQVQAPQTPVVIPVEAYLSREYAQAEMDRLWSKTWQVACRVEEIPEVGDFVVYDIMDESIVVVRSAADTISAYYNVCQHRGRRLVEGSGNTRSFLCKFHGWSWGLDGENTFVLDADDYAGCLNADSVRLPAIATGTWGGWVWINMDPDCVPLLEYLEPAASMLAPFEIEKMRYRWRKWRHVPCNWKTAIEAFNESFHATTVHPEFVKYGENFFWCKAENHCSWHGQNGSRDDASSRSSEGGSAGSWSFAGADDADWRVLFAEIQNDVKTFIDATTTDTLVEAANRLVDELPAGTPAGEVMAHLMTSAYTIDAERGVAWPQVAPEAIAATGHDWHIFPNTVLLHGLTSTLCYRARPHGADPNSCIFEVYVIERYPEGEAPKTEWEHVQDPDEAYWPRLLSQDFFNMPEVQKGMKSRGFKGPRPSPLQELGVIHFHNVLARYMGTGAPEAL